MSAAVAAREGAIDYWCNAFTPDRAALWDAAIAAQGVPVKVRRAPDDSFATPAELVARMDELGVATVVLPVGEPHHPGDPTDFGLVGAVRPDEAAELRRAHPGRFAAMWSYDPAAGRRGVRRAAAALAEGAVALHLHTHSFDRSLDHRDQYPFYELAAEHGVPVVMQAGTSGALAPSECGKPIGIDRPAIFFDDVTFVLSHMGWPWVEEAVAMALKFPNVYLGTAVYPRRHWGPALEGFLRGPGRRKVLYGSGFPAAGHRHTLGQLEGADLEPGTLRAYLRGNALDVFGRLRAEVGGA